jgi:hypothetical protein
MNAPLCAETALIVFLAVTASILGMTFMWATTNRHPVRARHSRLRERPILPHAYTRLGSPEVSTTRAHAVAPLHPTGPRSGT